MTVVGSVKNLGVVVVAVWTAHRRGLSQNRRYGHMWGPPSVQPVHMASGDILAHKRAGLKPKRRITPAGSFADDATGVCASLNGAKTACGRGRGPNAKGIRAERRRAGRHRSHRNARIIQMRFNSSNWRLEIDHCGMAAHDGELTIRAPSCTAVRAWQESGRRPRGRELVRARVRQSLVGSVCPMAA
jgi:hypothetical protein